MATKILSEGVHQFYLVDRRGNAETFLGTLRAAQFKAGESMKALQGTGEWDHYELSPRSTRALFMNQKYGKELNASDF